ncbi:hypothetical protein Taro_044183 [Colocasia esculenta]|uniref:Uncharacterized protein n=1 Tax=Colocasia esculenta TaxID=4460 RepID=A0A843X547_COLES|nr:hypothetical protein [Colocasia esculenta]
MRTTYHADCCLFADWWWLHLLQELEEKRKQRSQVAYERKKQLNRCRAQAEAASEQQLGRYWVHSLVVSEEHPFAVSPYICLLLKSADHVMDDTV